MPSPPDDENPSRRDDPDKRPEKRLGKYRIVRQLGRGGMGVVYEAEDTLLKRAVAIKVLSSRVARNQESLQRFLREAQATAKLHHPHVVAIYEVNQHDGLWFIAMELITGGNLADFVSKKGPLPWLEATRAISEACQGLMAAHQAGLLHRDIKPANLMRTPTGHVKVVDFGLAKEVADRSALTMSGVVVGTPHFMSPEQWRAEPLDDLSDIYSLGATYYSLVTGQPPFGDRAPLQVMYACCSEAPPDPRRIVPDLPDGCAGVIRRAMAGQPADRYPNASAMLVDLSALEASQVVLPPEATFPSNNTLRLGNTVQVVPPPVAMRNKTGTASCLSLAAGAALAVLAMGALLWGGLGWLGRDPGSPPPKSKRETKIPVAESGGEERWTSLFNGRDLTGWWKLKSPPGDWSVAEGAIVGRVARGGNDPSSYLLTDRNDYGNFELRLEARINEGGNSGVFFRCNADPSLPQGLEAHLATDYFGDFHRTWSHQNRPPDKIEGVAIAVVPGAWQQLRLVANGQHVTIEVNGRVTKDVVEAPGSPSNGYIGLQVFGDRDTEVAFRRIEIRELP